MERYLKDRTNLWGNSEDSSHGENVYAHAIKLEEVGYSW